MDEEALRCIEDYLSEAWRLGGKGKGIDVSEKAERAMLFLESLGYRKPASGKVFIEMDREALVALAKANAKAWGIK